METAVERRFIAGGARFGQQLLGPGDRLGRGGERERDVLEQLVIGRPNKLIGYELGISPRTVEIHRSRVMQKMSAKSLSHLVRIALAAGIDPEST